MEIPISLKELLAFRSYQMRLFSSAVKGLKLGGTLVYSTCTIYPEENENLVAWALSIFPNLRLVAQEPHLGLTGLNPNSLLTEEQCKYLQRFDSIHMDTIGFFIAKFVKYL